MVDCGDNDLEEIGENASEEIVVMAEPVRAICYLSKVVFNANYFKMLRRKQLEQLYGVINLSDSDSETEGIPLLMTKLMVEEDADLQKQREESARQRKGKGIAVHFGAAESDGDGESISLRTYRINIGLTPDEIDLLEGCVEYVREL
ncbi:hypothetical protein Fot_30385 [Forsythia ovata]|uniref:Uncharacterized protein n=1 Tax=Forsythia ovata TaxID=205694 RepID=A0ABD1TUK1_9LAMI